MRNRGQKAWYNKDRKKYELHIHGSIACVVYYFVLYTGWFTEITIGNKRMYCF